MNRVYAMLIAAFAAASSAMAQGTEVAIGGLTHDTSLPVEVTSDSFSVKDEEGEAVFDGNVVVIQGPMRLAAARIEVSYSEGADAGRTEIREMVASGGVTYANGADAAESRDAVYDPEAGTLVMTGDVLLSQGKTVISGERLDVNLESGTGVMGGRVRTIFQTGNN